MDSIEKLNILDIDNILNMQNNSGNNILSKENILRDLEDKNYLYFVYKRNNKIIGYIAASMLFDHIDILSILTDKNYLKLGIASKLLKYLINYSSNLNIFDIFLEVRKSNIPAQNLYKKFDFNIISVRKNYYKDNNEDAYVLSNKKI